MMLATLSPRNVQAQYLFRYAVWGNYTPAPGDGYPFSNELCTGTTAVIHWDSDPLTTSPKFADWCPAVGPDGENFGVQYAAIIHAFVSAPFTFYLGSDDGSSLWIDGHQVMALAGERPFHDETITIPFLAGTNHSYLINYYANTFGGSAIAARVDLKLDVSAPPPDIFVDGPIVPTDPFAPPPDIMPSPEPSTVVLLATSLGILGVAKRVRRKTASRAAV
jgi:hypothetical protein